MRRTRIRLTQESPEKKKPHGYRAHTVSISACACRAPLGISSKTAVRYVNNAIARACLIRSVFLW